MEKEQFVFSGLNWVLKTEKIREIRTKLLALEQYGIEFEIVIHIDTRLIISGYTGVMSSEYSDSHVTFLAKNRIKDEEDGLDEDELLILTIDDDMNIDAKLLDYMGNISKLFE